MQREYQIHSHSNDHQTTYHFLVDRIKVYPFLNDPGLSFLASHDDVIEWKHFPRYWPFVRGIHQSPLNSPHKGQWRRALTVCICAWINGWISNLKAGYLRRHHAHHAVTVMISHTGLLDKNGGHLVFIFKCILQNKRCMFWFLWTLLRLLYWYQLNAQVTATHSLKQNVVISIKCPSQFLPDFFLQLVVQPMTKIMLHVLKIVCNSIKSGYPILKIALSCLNHIVRSQ